MLTSHFQLPELNLAYLKITIQPDRTNELIWKCFDNYKILCKCKKLYIILLLYKRKWKLAGYFLITPFIKRGKNGKILSWSSLRTEISNLRNIFLTTKIIQVSTKIQRLSNLITWVLYNKERFLKAKYKTYQQNSHTWW